MPATSSSGHPSMLSSWCGRHALPSVKQHSLSSACRQNTRCLRRPVSRVRQRPDSELVCCVDTRGIARPEWTLKKRGILTVSGHLLSRPSVRRRSFDESETRVLSCTFTSVRSGIWIYCGFNVSIEEGVIFVIMLVVIVSCHYAYDEDSGLSPHAVDDGLTSAEACGAGQAGTGHA